MKKVLFVLDFFIKTNLLFKNKNIKFICLFEEKWQKYQTQHFQKYQVFKISKIVACVLFPYWGLTLIYVIWRQITSYCVRLRYMVSEHTTVLYLNKVHSKLYALQINLKNKISYLHVYTYIHKHKQSCALILSKP